MKILIADDSPTVVDILQFLLQSQGYEIVTASDGIEAISKTYETRPDLVLLDIEMPKMNGYQVCRLLKSDQATTKIPIVILTSRGQKRDRFWGLSTGADEFITKDFESEQELFAAIQSKQDERRFESAVLRTLGASKKTLLHGLFAEFAMLGALSGFLAGLSATLLAWLLAEHIFKFDYQVDPALALTGIVSGTVIVIIAGLVGTRSVLTQPPVKTLRDNTV